MGGIIRKEQKCPVCGKKFLPAPMHVWKNENETNKAFQKLVCSYTCMRVTEKQKFERLKKQSRRAER